MASLGRSLLQIIAPKRFTKGGVAATGTYKPSSPETVLTLPLYNDHLDDLFTTRQADDSRTLIQSLARFDPDVSATFASYLTLANTEPLIIARGLDGQIDAKATADCMLIIERLTRVFDYTLGFQLKPSFKQLCEHLRYMGMLRGMVASELILDKTLGPERVRIPDPASLKWYEKKPGEYKPVQLVTGQSKEVSLDIPTFFVSFFRRDPTSIYPYSPFVAAINTIAARQQVVNDLYRIMQLTGYPRIDVKVLEEVVMKAAPAAVRDDPAKLKIWLADRLGEVRGIFNNLRADNTIVHWDSIEPKILNEKNPSSGIDIMPVINVLNAQNQAGLKTMSTIIGRGESGVNTGTVEARIAAMNADELNEPVAEVLSNLLSFCMHQQGFQGFVHIDFAKAELRPETELEPQRLIKSQRLRQDLSDGLITDEEYHLKMYGRLAPAGVKPLSGSGFMTPVADSPDVSPNSDPLGKSASPDKGKAQKAGKSNQQKPKKK